MKYKITFISDTHTKHDQITNDLPGGDLLIHAGDFMSSGYYEQEAINFFKWYDEISNYETKIFIAGNHDRLIQNDPNWVNEKLSEYKTIDYLQDEGITLYNDGPNGDECCNVRIYGSPWQPEFHNWAFNLPRGEKIKEKWDMIPTNTDILITHGPAFGKLDYTVFGKMNVGCENLLTRIKEIKPRIHVSGHIHEGAGIVHDGDTLFINASVLNERYNYINKPITIIFDFETNEWEIVD
jgi:Icc-related predicted phosphoesterase